MITGKQDVCVLYKSHMHLRTDTDTFLWFKKQYREFVNSIFSQCEAVVNQ